MLVFAMTWNCVAPLGGHLAATAAAAGFGGGDGSEEDPYVIATAEQLYEVSVSQSVYLDSHFQLTADIDFTGWDWGARPWTPIGTDADPFRGDFDGGDHVISGLRIHDPLHSAGLFGTNAGILRNVGLLNVDMNGGNDTGALAGSNAGVIHRAYTTGTVYGIDNVGGLVGLNGAGGVVQYSHSEVRASGSQHVGGLAGANTNGGRIDSAYATGDASGVARVGGLVGINYGASMIENAYATGDVSGNVWDIGGIAGFIGPGSVIRYVFATGNVTGVPGDKMGGLVGYSNSGSLYYGFWNNESTAPGAFGSNYGYGAYISGLSMNEMQDEESFAIWGANFSDRWWMEKDGELPRLSSSIRLTDVSSTVYLSEFQDLTLSGRFEPSEHDRPENLGLEVLLTDANMTPIAEASWPAMPFDGSGEWRTAIGYSRWTPTAGSLVDGQYSLQAWGTGSDRNTSVAKTDIVIDTEMPDIDLSASARLPDNTVTINADINDVSGVIERKWAPGQLAASAFVAGGTTFTGSGFAANANGMYTVYAKDRAGNTAVGHIRISAFPSPSSSPSPSGSTKTLLSGDADLQSLAVWAGQDPVPLDAAFHPDTLSYTATTTAARVELRVRASSPSARISLRGETIAEKASYDLVPGANRFELVVRAEDGTEKKYGVEISRSLIQFSDTAGHWAEQDILKAARAGLVEGYPDGTFRPNGLVTREEFAALLVRALSPAGEAEELVFMDRDQIGGWAKQAVARAAGAGLVKGYPDGTFRPSAAISRAEAALMLSRTQGVTIDPNASTVFSDDSNIPAWAKAAVRDLAERGIVAGRGQHRFGPEETATRAEAAVLLLRFRDTIER